MREAAPPVAPCAVPPRPSLLLRLLGASLGVPESRPSPPGGEAAVLMAAWRGALSLGLFCLLLVAGERGTAAEGWGGAGCCERGAGSDLKGGLAGSGVSF